MAGASHAAITKMVTDSIEVKQKLLADRALLDAIARVCDVCVDALKRGNKIIFAGNGGSAADSQHLAAEFVARFEFDRPGLASISLTVDTSALTAIGNDYGYEFVFSRQLESNGKSGDVFFGLSTSGNSKNIIKAVEQAKKIGVTTVALCGAGGKLKDMCDHALCAPSTHTPRIQECHGLIGHIICALCEELMYPEYKKPKV
ncbi:MAG TPA: D-sedoheptulose 7-phosphate isomerase [Nevskiaceae bacterium]|nr:D-sedoheptulose 7-phosphate isomerase [Nevskiaceae bacterium]